MIYPCKKYAWSQREATLSEATLSEVSSNIVNLNDSFKDLQSALIKVIYDDINEKPSNQFDTMNKTMKSVVDENITLNEKISKLTDNNIPAKSSIKAPAGRRFTPVGEGGSGRRPLPPQSLNILVGLTLKLLSLYCIVGLV